MQTLDEFVRDFRAEVGDIGDIIRDNVIGGWVNEGQERLRLYREQTAALSWNAGATSVSVPTDFHHIETVQPDPSICFPPYRVWGDKLVFIEKPLSSGTATLLYWANWPKITASAPSLLPDLGDQAALSFALYRFFKRLSSSRADYRMYASIAQANGVGVDELSDLSERHLQDFEDARTSLSELLDEAASFYAE